MPSPSPIRLSQELIDKIVDFVAADYKDWPGEDLLQCALASRAFRPRSLSHIFSSILIRGVEEERIRKIRTLLEIIQRNPSVAHHVDELIIYITDYECSWIAEDATFRTIMRKITSGNKPLRKFVLKADAFTDDLYEILTLENPSPILHDFFLPFIGPTITSLRLCQILYLPVDAITSCVNLAELELLHVELTESEEEGSNHQHSLQLRSLSHRLAQSALQTLLNPVSERSYSALDLSQLKSFTVYTDGQRDLSFEQRIIDAAQGSLEEVYLITMQTECNGLFHGAADLKALPHLRLLHAHVLFPEDGLTSICRTLSSVRPHSLDSLFIDAKVAFCDLSDPEIILDADWTTFCAQVSRVMSGNGPGFELRMTYRYRAIPSMELEDYEALLNRRCEIIIDKLRREKLALLMNMPNFPATVSHLLDYDLFCQI